MQPIKIKCCSKCEHRLREALRNIPGKIHENIFNGLDVVMYLLLIARNCHSLHPGWVYQTLFLSNKSVGSKSMMVAGVDSVVSTHHNKKLVVTGSADNNTIHYALKHIQKRHHHYLPQKLHNPLRLLFPRHSHSRYTPSWNQTSHAGPYDSNTSRAHNNYYENDKWKYDPKYGHGYGQAPEHRYKPGSLRQMLFDSYRSSDYNHSGYTHHWLCFRHLYKSVIRTRFTGLASDYQTGDYHCCPSLRHFRMCRAIKQALLLCIEIELLRDDSCRPQKERLQFFFLLGFMNQFMRY